MKKNDSPWDISLLERTLELANKCPASETAFSVGVIVITLDGEQFSWYSRETGVIEHAEEVAIQKALDAWKSLVDAILYSSLEPCSHRASKEISCSQLIIQHQFKKCVFAALEDDTFVSNCRGKEDMQEAGIEVVHIEIPKL